MRSPACGKSLPSVHITCIPALPTLLAGSGSVLSVPRSRKKSMGNRIGRSLFNKERDFFIKLAQNAAWILQNGTQYEGFHNLCVSYAKFLKSVNRGPDLFFIEQKGIEKALAPLSHDNMLYNYVMAKRTLNNLFFGFVLINHLTSCYHILLMTALCGHPKTFYSKPAKRLRLWESYGIM